MTRSQSKPPPTHYQILQVHPAAPLELITSAYWRLVSQVHTAGRSDKAAEVAVYHLTYSYQVLANHRSRLEYNHSLGIPEQSGIPPIPAHPRTSWLSSLLSSERPRVEADFPDVDYYELLRVDPLANPGIVAEAHVVMRNHYLRLVEKAGVSRDLIDLLTEGYEVIYDPKRRREYDRSRKARRRAQARAAAHARRDAASVNGQHPPLEQDIQTETSARSPAEAKRSRSKRAPEEPGGESASQLTTSGEGAAGTPRDAEPLSIKLARSLAVGSAAAGKHSVNFARKASQTLRNLIVDDDEEVPVSVIELTPAEEEALLERLSTFPDAPLPSETQPNPAGNGVLAQLSIVEGPGFGTTLDIEAVPCTLGEDDSCDITLPGLARQQARLLHRDGQFVLFSLTDEPKTTIHGDSIAWAALEDGDSFSVGPYLLKFQVPSLTAAVR
jgi:curved DNA-binding protein CbpA